MRGSFWSAALLCAVIAGETARAMPCPTLKLLFPEGPEDERGNQAWFGAALERVEAELENDVRRARVSADEIAALARERGDAAVQAAAEELALLAIAMLEGPQRVSVSTKPTLAADAPATLRAHYYLARARRAWLADRPAEVLADTLASLTAARESAELLPFLRAAWFLHDITEDEAPDLDAELLREIESSSRESGAQRFEGFRRLTEYWRSWSGLNSEERLVLLDEAGRLAEAVDDVRTQIQVDWDRAVLASESGEYEQAFKLLEQAHAASVKAGFLREEIVSLEIAADFALTNGELDRAFENLDRSAVRLEGRGLIEAEIRLAHLSLRLASAVNIDEDVKAWTAELEDLRKQREDRNRDYPRLRQQFFAAELARIALEREMAKTRSLYRRLVGTGLASTLVLLSMLALVSRMRLAQTNRRLQQEVKRAETAQQARVELEMRMRQLERAQSLGLIASGVAHDFNNLMMGVLGSAELLRVRHVDLESRRELDAIEDAVNRGVRLCRQLQTYAGGEPARLKPVDIGALVQELLPAMRSAIGPEIGFEWLPCSDVIFLTADRSQLEQALLNLVSNARDAQARHICMRVRKLRLTEADWKAEFHRGSARPGDFVCLEVEDDGEGLSQSLLERIFDPFFSTRFPGRGLGLAVVLGATQRHDGAVAVSSQPGKGSRFRLLFPLHPTDHEPKLLEPQKPRQKLPFDVTPMNVLVIDDDFAVADSVRRILQARGHHVLATEDSSRALELLNELGQGARRVALVDLSMPQVDGREVVRCLLEQESPPAIVLMSGHSTTNLIDTAHDLHADGYLAKPFLSAELEEALVTAIQCRERKLQEPLTAG